jgi:Holliday junction resolvase RusA-like endonuclease
MIEVSLPLPPSTNNLYVSIGKRRVISPRYRAWLEAAGKELIAQKPRPVLGDYDLWLYFVWPDQRRRDLDNFIKAVSDLLVRHKLLDDDSRAHALHIYREIKGKQCVVRVCERKAA